MSISRTARRRNLLATALLPLLVPGIAFAQQAAPGSAANAAENPNDQNDIIVTATRKAERLVDVGAAVAVVSGEDLRQQKIEQVRDLLVRLPNADVKEQFPGILPVVTIRGVGLDDLSVTNNPAAGVYIDEVGLASLALMNTEYFDLERVEVVRGPQGTLYGRNSTAGAINVISAKPTADASALLSAGYGNYNTFTAEGYVNAPLADGVALRFSGKTVQSDGFFKSSVNADGTPGERDMGKRHLLLGRAQLGINPGGAFDANLKVEALHSRGGLGFLSGEGLFFNDPDKDPYSGRYPYNFPLNVDQQSVTGTIHYDVGVAKLTSVTGYINFKRHFFLDGDGTEAFAYHTDQADKVKQFSEEVRLAGETPVVDWLVGGIYSWDHVLGDINVEAPAIGALFAAQFNAAAPGLGDLIFGVPPFLGNKGFFDQTTTSVAGFANGTWHVADKLDLITGLRYTHERRRFSGGTDWTPNIPGIIGDALLTNARLSDNNISYRLQLNFKPMTNTLIYASATQGVKSGGFFSGTVTDQSQIQPYKPERLRAYELGAKVQRRTFNVNADVFYYDYKDMQTLVSIPGGQTVGNVQKAKIYGAELEVGLRPVEGLMLSGSLGYLHTELGAFASPSGPIAAGNRAPNSPKFSASGTISYDIPVASWTVRPQTTIHYVTDMVRDATNNPNLASPKYATVDGSIVVMDAARVWELTLWGKNLTNKIVPQSGIDQPQFGLLIKTYRPPFTFGVTVARKF